MSALVRVIWRGIDGELILEGSFQVLHKELGEDGTIDMVLADPRRRVTLRIPCEVLEEVGRSARPEEIRASVARAEDHLIERLRL